MNRSDYLDFMDQALASEHGIRIELGTDREAKLVRGKMFRIRHECREDARLAIDVLQPLPSPLTPYDELQFRVHAGCLWILRKSGPQPGPRRVDDRPLARVQSVTRDEVDELPPWPIGPKWGR